MGGGVSNSYGSRCRVPDPPLTPLGQWTGQGNAKVLAGDWEGITGVGG